MLRATIYGYGRMQTVVCDSKRSGPRRGKKLQRRAFAPRRPQSSRWFAALPTEHQSFSASGHHRRQRRLRARSSRERPHRHPVFRSTPARPAPPGILGAEFYGWRFPRPPGSGRRSHWPRALRLFSCPPSRKDMGCSSRAQDPAMCSIKSKPTAIESNGAPCGLRRLH